MQSPPHAELGRIELWASNQGNIAVKPAPIRLSALWTGILRAGMPSAPRAAPTGLMPARRVRFAAHKLLD